MRDQQRNAPEGLNMTTGSNKAGLATGGSNAWLSASDVQRGYSVESCEDYGSTPSNPSNDPLNVMYSESDGGFLKRDHGFAR